VVPRENVDALAYMLIRTLDQRRRTDPDTEGVLEREFRPPAVAAHFRSIYERVL
jgi:hypothetical protein